LAILQAKYDTLKSAYDALLTVVPKSQDKTSVPIYPKTPHYSQDKLPHVRFYFKDDYLDHKKGGGKQGDYLEDIEGNPVSARLAEAVRNFAAHIYIHLLRMGWAGKIWSEVAAPGIQYYIYSMVHEFNFLAYCEGNYKSLQVATENFSSWIKKEDRLKLLQSLSLHIQPSEYKQSQQSSLKRRSDSPAVFLPQKKARATAQSIQQPHHVRNNGNDNEVISSDRDDDEYESPVDANDALSEKSSNRASTVSRNGQSAAPVGRKPLKVRPPTLVSNSSSHLVVVDHIPVVCYFLSFSQRHSASQPSAVLHSIILWPGLPPPVHHLQNPIARPLFQVRGNRAYETQAE
jgi:hypothetical protein